MKKIWITLSIIGVISLSSSNSYSWPRLGQGANIVMQNSGDKASGISVTVSSTSATQVYSTQNKHREILLQNTSSSYYVYCGTFSAVNASSGPRWMLPPKPTGFTTNGYYSIYCIGEPDATSIEIIGSAEYDSKDTP